MENIKIDFVIPWVNGADPEWIAEKNKYIDIKDKTDNSRFRDWDLLRYWFRSVEKFARWVNHIYFITWGHVPEWLNINNPKLTIVNHKDFIPQEYLPTFSSHVIELNIHRIKGLSEHFVYFNDDLFLTDYVEKDDFFIKGLPAARALFDDQLLCADYCDDFKYYMISNSVILNKYFKKRNVIRKFLSKFLCLKYGKQLLKSMMLMPTNTFLLFSCQHLTNSFLKSTFEEVWEKEYDVLNDVCKHKFRYYKDVNQYLMVWWQFCTGKFMPCCSKGEYYGIDNQENFNIISNKMHKCICLNDTVEGDNIEAVKQDIIKAFETILPDKSFYEKY